MEQNRGLARGWDGGCSCVSWSTADGKHLWGRNYDFDRIARGTAVTWLPAGTAYFPGGQEAGPRLRARYGAAGVGSLLIPGTPVLFEGINDRGLMGGQLNYREFARYPERPAADRLPLAPPFLVGHVLSQCASVEEAARMLAEEVSLADIPVLGAVPTLHWAFSDATGEMMIVEPDAGGLRIYRNTLGVMTNSPGYPWHRTNLLNYTGIQPGDREGPELDGAGLSPCFSGSGAQGLPGDWSSPSRFVRLAFLRQYAVKGRDEAQGTAYLFRLLQSAAFPLGMVKVPQTAAAAHDTGVVPYDYTLYSCVLCAESRRFYWTTYEDQSPRYVELDRLALCREPVQLPLEGGPEFRLLAR